MLTMLTPLFFNVLGDMDHENEKLRKQIADKIATDCEDD